MNILSVSLWLVEQDWCETSLQQMEGWVVAVFLGFERTVSWWENTWMSVV